MTINWLLAVPYLSAAAVMIGVSWILARSAYKAATVGDRTYRAGACVYGVGICIAIGLAILSWVSAVTGVASSFRVSIVSFVFLIMLLPGGLALLARYCWLAHEPRDRLWITRSRYGTMPHVFPRCVNFLAAIWSAPILERCLSAAAAFLFLLLSLNALLGALVPDMNQDPLWYHLSVPQQWVFDGKFAVYPSVMPSAYPLAAEALFALIFLFSIDPVLCSVLVASTGIVLMLTMAAATCLAIGDKPRAGWGLGAVVCLLVPTVAVYGLMAPVQPKNDILTMLWMFAGGMALWLPLLSKQHLSAKSSALAGILLATACSAKPIVLPISGLVVLGAFLQQYRSTKFQPTLRIAIIFCFTWLVAAAPWLYRGYTTHGLPLFPLFQGLFPINPTYHPTIDAFNRAHAIPGGNGGSWLVAFLTLPGTLARAASHGEEAIYLLLITGVVGLATTHGPWRMFSAVVAAQVLIVASGGGQPVIFRLLAPAYCIAAPLAGYLAANAATAITRPTRLVTGAIILALTFTTAIIQQVRSARMPTYNWRFRPVLSKDDISAYARHAEHGYTYLSFALAQQVIPAHQKVLLLGSHYPFYLHRSTLWNDEVVTSGGLEDRWEKFSANAALNFMETNGITMVLYVSDRVSTGTAERMVREDVLKPLHLPRNLQMQSWSLYSISEASPSK